jgi:hypothetical protein
MGGRKGKREGGKKEGKGRDGREGRREGGRKEGRKVGKNCKSGGYSLVAENLQHV